MMPEKFKHLKRIALVLLAAICGFSSPGGPAAPATPPTGKESFHIYLLMGQSNMAGRDTHGLDAQFANPRILALNAAGQWEVARDPLHQKDGRIEPGVGPGLSFALAMLESDTNITIGLVPCAVGGSPLRRWVKGGDLYEKAVSRARLAAKAGVIKGVLWHQGESDSDKQQNAETYEARLTQTFKDLRADLDLPGLPIVVGQLGEFLPPEKHPFAGTVRAAIQNIPAVLAHVGYADSAGLRDKGDKLHFNAESQREFGRRFAAAIHHLTQPPAVAPAGAAAGYDLWPESRMPGHGASEPETEHSPERTDARRITNVSRPTLTLFPASQTDKPAPVMIVCPGGGYSYVVVDKEGSEIAAWLNTNGVTALVLKYRVPHNRDGALQDVQRALSLARAHAAEWNIDARRLGVIGFSAGGNLAALASTRFAARTYAPVDGADAQSCRPDFAVLVYPAYLDDRNGRVATNLNLQADIPPTLIVHSEDDLRFVPGSKLYDAALSAAKIPHEFALYPTGGHGYGLRCEREARAWPERALEWMGRNGFCDLPRYVIPTQASLAK
jgi:acetyl esterase/lipase